MGFNIRELALTDLQLCEILASESVQILLGPLEMRKIPIHIHGPVLQQLC